MFKGEFFMLKTVQKMIARNENPFEAEPVTIVCIGDSVTHGCFENYLNHPDSVDTVYEPKSGYVRMLQDRLFELYPLAAVNVINAGIGGDDTKGALKRFERDVERYHPDLVTINLALNDYCAAASGEAGALGEYAERLRMLIHKTKQIGAECIIVTPNMVCKYIDPTLKQHPILSGIAEKCAEKQNNGIADHYVASEREVAREEHVPIADVYALWKGYEASGIDTTALLANLINHPIREKHYLFADKIVETMLK